MMGSLKIGQDVVGCEHARNNEWGKRKFLSLLGTSPDVCTKLSIKILLQGIMVGSDPKNFRKYQWKVFNAISSLKLVHH